MPVSSRLLSVAEFVRLPQSAEGFRQELQHGQVVEMPPAKKLHTRLQKRLVNLLDAALNPAQYAVDKEFPFRPAPEYEVWIADVAVFHLSLWEETPDDDYFRGTPEIVIEVLSPSNSASAMMDREAICLRNGAREFWLVDPERECVQVVGADGYSKLYGSASLLHSTALTNPVAVRDIFAR